MYSGNENSDKVAPYNLRHNFDHGLLSGATNINPTSLCRNTKLKEFEPKFTQHMLLSEWEK